MSGIFGNLFEDPIAPNIMKTHLLTELSDEQQESVTGGKSVSDLTEEVLKKYDDAKELIAKLLSDDLPTDLTNALDELNKITSSSKLD